MLVLAFGIGVSFPALMTLAMSGATQEDAGLASGLVNTTAQVGGALGLAVLATLSTTRTDNLIADGEARASALTDGYHLAFWIGAAGRGVLGGRGDGPDVGGADAGRARGRARGRGRSGRGGSPLRSRLGHDRHGRERRAARTVAVWPHPLGLKRHSSGATCRRAHNVPRR